MGDFTFEVNNEFGDHVLEERNNTSIIMRKIRWGESSSFKLDIRKYIYTEEGERMNKGISLTDEGANELTKELISSGYGDTKEILKTLRYRKDFDDALNNIDAEEELGDEYYDPRELLA